jgi:hypothetical protein
VMHETPTIRAILHVEPDLWGYGMQVNHDPSQIPVALSSVGMTECQGLPDTFAGFGQCLLAIARAEAPNVLVGFHASAWGAGADALMNTSTSFDLAGHAQQTATFMAAVGAGNADVIVVEHSDRDAGFNNRWWNTDTTLPNFTQTIAWAKTLGDALGRPPLWWQIPYGDMAGNDTCNHYRDNRVDYFFAHPDQYAAGGALGIAFGAGASCQTTPEYDGGHFIAHAQAYYTGTRPLLCGL